MEKNLVSNKDPYRHCDPTEFTNSKLDQYDVAMRRIMSCIECLDIVDVSLEISSDASRIELDSLFRVYGKFDVTNNAVFITFTWQTAYKRDLQSSNSIRNRC